MGRVGNRRVSIWMRVWVFVGGEGGRGGEQGKGSGRGRSGEGGKGSSGGRGAGTKQGAGGAGERGSHMVVPLKSTSRYKV